MAHQDWKLTEKLALLLLVQKLDEQDWSNIATQLKQHPLFSAASVTCTPESCATVYRELTSAGEAVDLGKLIQRLHKERIEELKEDITKERTLVGNVEKSLSEMDEHAWFGQMEQTFPLEWLAFKQQLEREGLSFGVEAAAAIVVTENNNGNNEFKRESPVSIPMENITMAESPKMIDIIVSAENEEENLPKLGESEAAEVTEAVDVKHEPSPSIEPLPESTGLISEEETTQVLEEQPELSPQVDLQEEQQQREVQQQQQQQQQEEEQQREEQQVEQQQEEQQQQQQEEEEEQREEQQQEQQQEEEEQQEREKERGKRKRTLDEEQNQKKQQAYKRWKKGLLNLIEEVMTHRHTAAFNYAVTEEDAPGYAEAVKVPIHLSAIKTKLRADHYQTLEELHKDLMLVFLNAVMFNAPKTEIYSMSLEMWDETERQIRLYKQAISTSD